MTFEIALVLGQTHNDALIERGFVGTQQAG